MKPHCNAQIASEPSVGVLVLDASEPMRLGLALMLRRQDWVERCLTARDLDQAVALTRRFRPAVVLIDASGTDGFAATVWSTLRRVHPQSRIVYVVRNPTLTAGLEGTDGEIRFLRWGMPGTDVVSAVYAAAFDEPASVGPRGQTAHLTSRELEILKLLTTGATNREIALALHLGVDSIKKHLSSIYRKLGVRNRTEATRAAALSHADD